ncbi:MAG: hypothetical protein ACRC92_23500 [Peptostreptococcaceae bacterium]
MSRTLLAFIKESAKSEKYYKEAPDYLEEQTDNILGMRTVKEGTAFAGAFCNWIMEVASVNEMDLVPARNISNNFQREALDSKSTKGGLFSETAWFKIIQLKNSVTSNDSTEDIERKIIAILNGESIEIEKKSDDSFLNDIF